jgi:hypothetical protein
MVIVSPMSGALTGQCLTTYLRLGTISDETKRFRHPPLSPNPK